MVTRYEGTDESPGYMFVIFVQRRPNTEDEKESGWYTIIATDMAHAQYEAPELWYDHDVLAVIGPVEP